MSKISDEAYEELRLILEKRYGQTFTLEEIREIGNGLIGFYELLMRLDAEKKGNIDEVS